MIYLSLALTLLLTLSSCTNASMQPLPEINNTILKSSTNNREPSLGIKWLASLALYNGKERIELTNLLSRTRVPLPGLNSQDSQPISVSLSADGQRLALIRQRGNRTELLLYRRNFGTLQLLEINPAGIPKKVSIDATGKLLAVQVSRDGYWEVDLLRLPN